MGEIRALGSWGGRDDLGWGEWGGGKEMTTVTLGHHYLGGQRIREVSSPISCIAGILFLSHISFAVLKECVQ